MAKSIALAPDASRLALLLLSYIRAVCAFVAPRHPGASSAIIDRLSHSRALRQRGWERPWGARTCTKRSFRSVTSTPTRAQLSAAERARVAIFGPDAARRPEATSLQVG